MPGVDVTTTEDEPGSVLINVSIEASRVASAIESVLQQFASSTQIPGFPKGAKDIPKWVLLNNIDPNKAKGAVLEDLLEATMGEALEASGIADKAFEGTERIAETGEVLLTRVNLKEPGPITYGILVDVQQPTSWAGDYTNLSVEVEFPVGNNLDEEAVERAVGQAQKDAGNLRVEVSDGIVKGDVAVVDLQAVDPKSGNTIESATHAGFRLETDTDGWFDELLNGVMGMKVNEERVVECNFPPRWDPPELSETPAKFTITLKELFRWDLAQEDDELAARLYEGASDMAFAREAMLGEAKAARIEAFEKQLNESIGYALGDIFNTTIPRRMVEENGRQLYGARLLEMMTTGQINREMLERLSSEQMVSQYVQANIADLEKQTRADLAIAAVQEEQGLSVTPEEVEEEVENQIKDIERKEMATRAELNVEEMRDQAVQNLHRSKVFSFLRNHGVSIVVKDPDTGASVTIQRPEDYTKPGMKPVVDVGGGASSAPAAASSGDDDLIALPPEIEAMKGKEVDAALKERSLPRTGKVAERKARLAEAMAGES